MIFWCNTKGLRVILPERKTLLVNLKNTDFRIFWKTIKHGCCSQNL